MEYKVTHLPERQRFETIVDGYTGSVKYRLDEDSLDVMHTNVPVPIEGRGVAAALVKSAYDYARENNLKCEASCGYAVAWLRRHPEYME